ncbi:CoA-binding protein [Bacteroidota bacterium]
MVTKKEIDNFFDGKKFAIAGVSRNKKKFGNLIYREMKQKGYDVVGINPDADKIGEDVCYKDVKSIPEGYEKLLIITPPKSTEDVVKQAVENGIKNIWIQHKSETKEAISIAEKANISTISGKCIFMYAEPVNSFHAFHKMLAKLFGVYAK